MTGEHRVVTSRVITTLVVSRDNGGQPGSYTNARREVMPMSCFTLVVDVLAARSSYAKDREHTSSGRSPDFWLQALLISPSHSNSEQWLDLFSVGEGTGAVLAMSIIEAALHAHREMATFAEAGVSTREE